LSKLIGTLLSHFIYFQAIGSFLHVYRTNKNISIENFLNDSSIFISLTLLIIFLLITRIIYSKFKHRIFN